MKVNVVSLDTIEYSAVREYARLLSQERQEKIDRYRFESDKLLSLAAGLLIRDATGDSRLTLNEHGKPCAADGSVHFSVSHSGKCAAIAVDSAEVGLDVEKLPDRDFLPIARRFYHPEELRFVEQAEDQARAFTRIWTRKEAYLKQLGIGIATDLKAFDTTSGELSERIVSIDLEGYVISVCAAGPISEKNIDISKIELKDLL